MKKVNVSQNLFAFIKQPKISENLAYLPLLQLPPVEKQETKK